MLVGLAVAALVAASNHEIECSDAPLIQYGWFAAGPLVGLAALALAWARRRRWLYAAGTALLVFIPTYLYYAAAAIDVCTQ